MVRDRKSPHNSIGIVYFDPLLAVLHQMPQRFKILFITVAYVLISKLE